ncbi:MAG: hypothetical protein II331_07570 [Lachnospiraceae bacterium]|nr:hypothetical protein [Lachnospiraceae bacterium]
MKQKRVLALLVAFCMVFSMFSGFTLDAKAAVPTLNAKQKTIYVGTGTCSFKVVNPVKKSTYRWTSSNTKIAKVNAKTGVITPVSAGTATITVKITLPSKKTRTLKGTINVKESIKRIYWRNGTNGKSLAIGDNVYDYNVRITTASGGKYTDKVFFYINPDTNTAGATVTKTGVVSTQSSGSFDIQVLAAIDEKNYNAGKYTAKSSVLHVEVPFQVKGITLTKTNQIKIETNDSVKDLSKEAISIINHKTTTPLTIDSISESEDKKTITVNTTTSFTNDTEYTATLNGIATNFTAKIGEPASIFIPNQVITPGVATPISYTIYDENNIDITELHPYNSKEMKFVLSLYSLDSNGKLTLNSEGDATYVTLTYKNLTSNTAKVSAETPAITSINQFSIVPSGKSVSWEHTSQSLPLGDTNAKLVVQFKNVKGNLVESTTDSCNVTYTSLDPSILEVDKETGVLSPRKKGTAYIKVTVGDFTGTISVTVGEARQATTLTGDASLTLSCAKAIMETRSITYTLRDQYNSEYTLIAPYLQPSVKVLRGDENIVTLATTGQAITKTPIKILSKNTVESTFSLPLKAKAKGSAVLEVSYAGKSTLLTVVVAEPGTADGYEIDLSSTTLDPNSVVTTGTTMTLYEVDSNKVKRNVIYSGTYTVTDDKGNYYVKEGIINSDGQKDGDVIDAKVLNLQNGTYTITVSLGNVKVTKEFTVKSSIPVASYHKNASTLKVAATDDICEKILSCISLSVDGVNVTSAASKNVLIKYTSYDTKVLPSRSVFAGTTKFGFTKNSVKIKVTEITFVYNDLSYTLQPNEDITFTID